jgi:hypothetical protein
VIDVHLAGPPEVTAWCNVRFAVVVPGHGAPVLVSFGWDNDVGLESEDVDVDLARAAIQFVDSFCRTEVILVHHLLQLAREAYEHSDHSDALGPIPRVKILERPTVESGVAWFSLDAEGAKVKGALRSDLSWRCDERNLRVWSSAKHAAIAYALSNAAALESAGFDAARLRAP